MLAFAALVERHGLAWAKEVFSAWIEDSRYDPSSWLSVLPRLCQVLAAGEQGRALAEWLVAREVAAFKQRRVGDRQLPRIFAEENARGYLGELSALLEVAAVIRASAIRDELVAFLIAPATALPLATAGALLKKVQEGRTPAMVRTLGLPKLYRHVVDSLEGVLAAPERDPNDWSIEPPAGCTCALCRELAAFLRASDRTHHAWPLASEGRRHIHQVIDEGRVPVSHKTIREGRPFTLVLTKKDALFERDRAERARLQEILTWLYVDHEFEIQLGSPRADRRNTRRYLNACAMCDFGLYNGGPLDPEQILRLIELNLEMNREIPVRFDESSAPARAGGPAATSE